MSAKVIGENVMFQIRVEEAPSRIVLVLDRKCDYAIVPWQDAFQLAETMERIVQELKCDSGIMFPECSQELIEREQAQIRLAHHKGLVAILVEWTDRLRFSSLTAFLLTARALRKTAQDSYLEDRGIRIRYDRTGLIRKIMNIQANTIQFIR